MNETRIQLSIGSRLLVLLGLMGIGLLVLGLVAGSLPLLGVLTMQDLLVFALPAVVAMLISYRHPLRAMRLDRWPSWQVVGCIVAFWVVSLPLMNWLVAINEAMTLPSWMSSVEQWMRASEASAEELTQQLLATKSLPQLLATVTVVGVLAGLCEELLFRGALLRIVLDSPIGRHAAVWVVAAIFSAIHLEFFGFLPRMVLGAWFGYLALYTRSLWTPIMAHTLNNSMVVVLHHLAYRGTLTPGAADQLGVPASGWPWLAMLSMVLSIGVALRTITLSRRAWAHSSATSAPLQQ